VNIVLLGAPGAGKGTQAKRLRAALGLPHVASGDLFRAIRQEDTPLAEEIRDYMDTGRLVPDPLTIEVVLTRLNEPDASPGVILDGFPRTPAQAEALDAALIGHGRKVDVTLAIQVPPAVLIERVAGRLICSGCGAIYNAPGRKPRVYRVCDACSGPLMRRSDEDPEVVRTRLDLYQRLTQPLIEYYRQRGVLREIDGSQPVPVVEAEIDMALSTMAV
jgi:adenylate kinase